MPSFTASRAPSLSPRLQWMLFALAAFALAALAQFRSPNVTDPDNFYHFGHAAVYAEQGVWRQDFPWATYSVIRTQRADLWWGFHVLLLPFAFASDPVWGMKLAAAVMLALSLVAVAAALRLFGVRGAWVWALLLPLASSEQLWSLVMLRPQVLSLGLLVLLAALLMRGTNRQIFACALGVAWVHLTVSWLVLAVALAVLAVRGWKDRRRALQGLGCALAALVVALLLRPNPLGTARLMWVQIVELSALQGTGFPGAIELQPKVPGALLFDNGPFLVLWAASLLALVLYFRRHHGVFDPTGTPAMALSSALLSLACFELSLLQASRWDLYWIGFGLFALALTVQLWSQRPGDQITPVPSPSPRRRAVGGVVALGVMLMTAWSWIQNGWDMRFEGIPPRRLEAAGAWLRANSQPAQVAFHPDWPMFAELFFWNRHNRYIGGMDPVFQFAHSRELFWKNANVGSSRAPGQTSAAPDGSNPEDLHTVLRRDFDAEFLIMPIAVHPQLFETLRRDPRFTPAWEQGGVVIFRLAR